MKTKKSALDCPGPDRSRVFAILKEGRYVGRVVAALPPRGHGERPTYVLVNDWTDHKNPVEPQRLKAAGFSYDKLQGCMEQATFAGVQFGDSQDWECQLRDSGFEVLEVL